MVVGYKGWYGGELYMCRRARSGYRFSLCSVFLITFFSSFNLAVSHFSLSHLFSSLALSCIQSIYLSIYLCHCIFLFIYFLLSRSLSLYFSHCPLLQSRRGSNSDIPERCIIGLRIIISRNATSKPNRILIRVPSEKRFICK